MQPYISSTLPLLSERDLETQIRQALNNKFSGQIQITFLFGKTETLFVIYGRVCQVYIRNHRVPDLNWQTPIERFGAGTLKMEAMPARALMFRKVALEEITPAKSLKSSNQQLQPMFDMARTNPGPTLFHIQWLYAEAFVFVAGGRIHQQHAVLITPLATDEWKLVIDHIADWYEDQCHVTVYRGDIKNQAWLELLLNTLLEWYCQNLLNHYQQLTGVVMVRSILQNLLVLAENKGWNISIKNQELRCPSVFPSASEAGRNYRDVLAAMRSRMEPIIGSSLTQYIIKQSTERTTGIYKTIEDVFHLIENSQ